MFYKSVIKIVVLDNMKNECQIADKNLFDQEI